MKHLRIVLSMVLFVISTQLIAQDIKLNTSVKKGSIYWKSDDNQFKFHIGGRVFLDGATYFDDKTDLGSGSELRDVRLALTATVYGNWDAKINISFAGGKVTAKHIYLQNRFGNNSRIRVGYFFEPFGLEKTGSSKSDKFMTLSSSSEALGVGRNLGIAFATYRDKTFFEAGIFGDSDLHNKTGGDEAFGISSRFVVSPIHSDSKIIHFGIAAAFRKASAVGFNVDGSKKERSFSYSSRMATHIEKRKALSANVGNVDYQIKYGLEFIAAIANVSLQSEFITAKIMRNSGDFDYKAKGYYAQIAWLLKGGDYKYKMSSARMAKPEAKSLELVLRYNDTDLNDSKAAILGGRQKDISLAFNYFVNSNVQLKLSYSHVSLDENNQLSGIAEDIDMIQTRIQFAF